MTIRTAMELQSERIRHEAEIVWLPTLEDEAPEASSCWGRDIGKVRCTEGAVPRLANGDRCDSLSRNQSTDSQLVSDFDPSHVRTNVEKLEIQDGQDQKRNEGNTTDQSQ